MHKEKKKNQNVVPHYDWSFLHQKYLCISSEEKSEHKSKCWIGRSPFFPSFCINCSVTIIECNRIFSYLHMVTAEY